MGGPDWRSIFYVGGGLPLLLLPLLLLFLPESRAFRAAASLAKQRALAPGGALFGDITAMIIGLRVSLSLFIVPYVAMGAELSDDYAERSSIVVFRIIFTVLATLTATKLGFGVFLAGPGGLIHRAAYSPFGWTCGAIMGGAALFATLATLGARDRLHPATPNQGSALTRLMFEVVEVFKNPSFRTLFLGAVIFFVAQGVGGTVGLHANKYFWKLPTSVIQSLGYATAAGLVVGLPISYAMGRWLEKRTAVMIGLLVICGCQFLPTTLQLAGVMPQGEALHSILIGNTVIAYAMITVSLVAFQSMAADAADEHEHLYFARREGLFFAGLSFAAKAAAGGGTLIAGICLDLVGFPSDVAAHGGEHLVVSQATYVGLGIIHGPVAGAGTLLAALLLVRYRLDRNTHAGLLAELGERRSGTVA